MEILEGQTQVPPAPQEGQAPTSPAGVIPLEALVQPPAAPPAPLEGQVQGQVDANVQEVMRIANQRYADVLRLQQENETLRRQQQPLQPPAQNPFDPNSDFVRWNQFENRQMIREAIQENTQGIIGTLMQTAQRQSEAQWQTEHPTVDINQVRMFAQQRWGVQNVTTQMMDDVIALQLQPQRLVEAQTRGAQNQINQFRQPQNMAQPIRGVSPAAQVPTQLSFEKLLPMYVSNPNVAETWDPRLREAFFAELHLRHSS